MSSASSTPAPSGSLVVLADKLQALDSFAENNNLAILTEGRGNFSSAIAVADAIGQLKGMLTAEVMEPIMKLQGSALGFKTDKDRDGGYPVEVVREAFIEGTLKGFKFVGNQANIIAGRFYATKEGFEDFFLRLARKGELTDYQDAYSTPKIVSESEAIVTASATWVYKGKAGKIENAQFSIRINKGQGADATIGKAKRKLKARVYERITGQFANEGDADEAAIPVAATVVGSSPVAGAEKKNGPTEEQAKALTALLADPLDATAANKFLIAQKAIPEGATYLDVTEKLAAKILGNTAGFLKAIHQA